MPSATAHLVTALDLLEDPALAARQRLLSEQGAFLLGSVSPDVRMVSGLTREETHFYDIPVSSEAPAAQTLLETYPTLSDAHTLSGKHAAFIAGYLTHLIMDETWLEVVVMPYIFIDRAVWDSNHPNYRLYSLLMIHLAEEGARHVTPQMIEQMRACQPQGWLPFASDQQLIEWRDRVAAYCSDNSGLQTARMFAAQMKIEAEELYSSATSQTALENELHTAVPGTALKSFQRQTHERCLSTLNQYMAEAAT